MPAPSAAAPAPVACRARRWGTAHRPPATAPPPWAGFPAPAAFFPLLAVIPRAPAQTPRPRSVTGREATEPVASQLATPRWPAERRALSSAASATSARLPRRPVLAALRWARVRRANPIMRLPLATIPTCFRTRPAIPMRWRSGTAPVRSHHAPCRWAALPWRRAMAASRSAMTAPLTTKIAWRLVRVLRPRGSMVTARSLARTRRPTAWTQWRSVTAQRWDPGSTMPGIVRHPARLRWVRTPMRFAATRYRSATCKPA